MSSPYSLETKRGTEESIEAMEHARTWLSRIDTRNDATNLNLEDIDSQLSSEIERLEEYQRIKVTEVAIDNFVFNHEDEVERILTGDLDEKVSLLNSVHTNIKDEFGWVSPPSLSKENILWFIAQEVRNRHIEGVTDYYDHLSDMDLTTVGDRPDRWEGESYPIHG